MRIANRLMTAGGKEMPAVWASSTPMPVPKCSHAQVTLSDGRVLVIGGRDVNRAATATCYIGTVSGDTISWVSTNSLPNNRISPTAVTLQDGRVLVVGGGNSSDARQSTVYLGTVSGDTISWITSTSYPTTITEMSAIVLPDGRAAFIGGYTSDKQVRFGTVTGNTVAWATGTSIPAGRRFAGLMVTSDGRLMVSGGCTGTTNKLVTLLGTITGNTVSWASNGPAIPLDFFFRASTQAGTTLILADVEYGNIYGWDETAQEPSVYAWRNSASSLPDGRSVMTGGYVDGNETTVVNNTYIGKFIASATP